MGRKKLEIKRIESKSSRQVTFCKRRNGLMEKARQLSILCESSVAVLIVSSTGKLYSSSSGDSMPKILSRYEIQHVDELKRLCLKKLERDRHLTTGDALEGYLFLLKTNTTDHNLSDILHPLSWQDLAEKTRNYLSYNELLEIVQCKLEENNISLESLISLEEQFETALSVTRARKTELMMELVKTLQEKEKMLREVNQVLGSQLTKVEKKQFLDSEDERAMTLVNISGNNTPETLPLLK